MDSHLIGFIGIGGAFLLIIAGIPVAVSLGMVGIAGTMILKGFHVGLDLGGMIPFSSVASYLLTIIPLFLLMGSFAMESWKHKNAYDIGNKWWTIHSEKAYHYCLISCDNNKLKFESIKPDGTVFDSFV